MEDKKLEKIKNYKASLPRRIWCRLYQRVMYVAEYMLPWRVPEQISGEGSLKKLAAFCKSKGFTLAEDSRHESDDGYERDIWRCSTIIDEEVFECDVDYVAATDMTASRSWWTLYIRVANTTAENETSFADGYESATYFVKYERTYNDLYEDKDEDKQEGTVTYVGVEVATFGAAGAAYGDVFSSDEVSYDGISSAQWKLDYETYLWLFDKSTRDNYTVDMMRKRLGERRELDVVSDYTLTRLDSAQSNYMRSRNRVKTGETKTIAGFECEKYTADVHANGDDEEDDKPLKFNPNPFSREDFYALPHGASAFFAVVQAIKNVLLNISSYYIRHGPIFKLAKSSKKCEFWQEFDV